MIFHKNPGNVASFVRWNKQKESARREMHFYNIESSIKDLTIEKRYQRAHLSVAQSLTL